MQVVYDDRYNTEMPCEIRVADSQVWQYHIITNVQHERLAGYSIITLEVLRGHPGYSRRGFDDGFDQGFG